MKSRSINYSFGLGAALLLLASPSLVPLHAQATASSVAPADLKSPLPNHVDGRGPTGPVELRILSPKPDEVIPMPAAPAGGPAPRGASVEVKFEIKNYEIFQDPVTKTGQHIHVILDNQPYFAHYDSSKAWLFKNIPPGTHTIRAFPSRPWHESIKEPGAFAMVTFHVGAKDGKNTPLPGVPLLTYSRPKGKYSKAEAAKVMLDFYVTGCEITDKSVPNSCRVRYKLDDQPEVTLTKWAPVWWEGLAVGKHTYVIGLTRDGKIVENGPFNLVKPPFEIEVQGAMEHATGPGDGSQPGSGTALPRPVPGPGGNEPDSPTRPPRAPAAGNVPEPTRAVPGPGGR